MELIDKDTLKDVIRDRLHKVAVYREAKIPIIEILTAIKEAPVIESRPKGKWIDNYSARNEEGFWKCSVCGREISLYNPTEKEIKEKYPYCNCGAYMRGE